MENKQNKIINIVFIIFLIWLIALTISYFFLSQSINSAINKIDSITSPTNLVNVKESDKFFGKYNVEDFNSFKGWFVAKIKTNNTTVLIIPGYLNLKPEILAKEKGPPPNFQMETKYIGISKNTKIVNDQGGVFKIDDIAPEDYLIITPQETTGYNDIFMLADKITVSKKVWPKGENPFE